jgi:hypothetical protein
VTGRRSYLREDHQGVDEVEILVFQDQSSQPLTDEELARE